jgi:hypothetical protein
MIQQQHDVGGNSSLIVIMDEGGIRLPSCWPTTRIIDDYAVISLVHIVKEVEVVVSSLQRRRRRSRGTVIVTA